MSQPATATPRRRRWSSYSLRSLFVLVTLMAIGLAWVAYERRQSQRELQIAEQLETSGAIITFAGLFDYHEPPFVIDILPPRDHRNEQRRWRAVLGVLFGPRVQGVEIYGEDSLADLSLLAGLNNLEFLELYDSRVSDLAPITGLKSLNFVNLENTHVRDLAPLAGLKNLESLNLSNTQISDLSSLAGLTKLEDLFLGSTRVSDLAPLAGLKDLKNLSLEGTPATDEQVKSLQQALPDCKIAR